MPNRHGNEYLSDNWTLQDDLDFEVYIPALMHLIEYAETPLTYTVILRESGNGFPCKISDGVGDLMLQKKPRPVHPGSPQPPLYLFPSW